MNIITVSGLLAVLLVSGAYGAIGSLFTIYGTGDPATSAGLTVTSDSTDSAYFIPDSVYVGTGASLTTWGPEALGGAGIGGDGDVALPVELAAFSARLAAGGVLLSWQTASETDNLGFNVLRSGSPDKDYNRINTELVPGNASAAGGTYSYTDTEPAAGVMYYKLQMVDTRGGTAESGVITVTYTPSGMGGSVTELTDSGIRGGMISLDGLKELFAAGTGVYRLYNAAGTPVDITGGTAVPAVYIVEHAAHGMITCTSVLVVEKSR